LIHFYKSFRQNRILDLRFSNSRYEIPIVWQEHENYKLK